MSEDTENDGSIRYVLISARQKAGLTQKELSRRTGIAQGDISKLEHGNSNPSVRTLQRLAAGMGMTLRIDFVPIRENK
ncbi:MAG: helix-turn-helix domain-containing protein [Lachnospiraceae bacterium]